MICEITRRNYFEITIDLTDGSFRQLPNCEFEKVFSLQLTVEYC